MQSLATLKAKSQESLSHITATVNQQPPEVQLWGTVAAAAIVGSVVVAAGAKGILAVVGTLAAPPVALTVGALGGGFLGWNFMQNQTAPMTAQPIEGSPAA